MTRTTLPVLPPTPPTLETPRLLLRPFSPTDVDHYNLLRRQPEVMKWTSTMRCDETVRQTEEWMARFLPTEDLKTFSFSIEELRNPGKVIGSAGCSVLPGKLPEMGYMLRKEVWGRGYATEAVNAVLEAYWGLERREVDVRFEAEVGQGGVGWEQERDNKFKALTEDGNDAGFQVESLLAVTQTANAGSRRVLEKFGFVRVREFRDWNTGGIECIVYVSPRPQS